MKKLFLICAIALAGCTSTSDKIDSTTAEKLIKLAEQIEMNDYKLVATNDTLLIISLKK